MKRRICGMSKRHMRRLVVREVNKSKSEQNCEVENISNKAGPADNIIVEQDTCNLQIVENVSSAGNSEKETTNQTISEEARNWAIENKIKRKACDEILYIMKKAGLGVPLSSKSLLETKNNQIEILSVNPGTYFHFGLQKSVDMLDITLGDISCLLIDIGIDGLPLFKSSGTQLWPILGCISNCLKLNQRPFLIGAYVGPRKPEKINQLLSEFVKEIKNLSNIGLMIKGKVVAFKINVFICDAPARAFVTGTVGHTASKGCSKCTQSAERKNKKLTYATSISSLRTDEDFAARKDKYHHVLCFHENLVALEEIDIKMVSQFPLDVIHLIDLGVAKKILTFIWNGKHSGRKLSHAEKEYLNRKLISYKRYIPKEFCRKPRSMHEMCRWKAVEFRQILLYTGIVLFKNIVDEDIYMHFLLLHAAYRLVSCSANCDKNVPCVREILSTFVANFQFLYGENTISYNVHNLLHLADCVENFGNVDNFSAYKFENKNFRATT